MKDSDVLDLNNLSWEPSFRKVHLPSPQELTRIVWDYKCGTGKWGEHRSAHAYYTWAHAYLNAGVIPTNVVSVFQCLTNGPQMYTPKLQAVITGDQEDPWKEKGTYEDLTSSRAFLNLIRVSLGFRLIEIGDSPPWFSMSSDLTYALLATDLGTLDKELKLPYPALIVEYPENLVRVNAYGGTYQLRTATIAEERAWTYLDQPKRALLISWMFARVTKDASITGVFNLPHVLMLEDNITPDGKLSLEVASTPMDIMLGEDVAESPLEGGFRVGEREIEKEEFPAILQHLTWMSVLYLCSSEPDILQRKPTARKKRRKGKSRVPVRASRDWELGEEYMVGSTIKVHPLVKTAALEGIRSTRTSVAYAHTVRGHFKMQPCGARRQDRRRIWIQPYVRNTEAGGPVVGHTYQVD